MELLGELEAGPQGFEVTLGEGGLPVSTELIASPEKALCDLVCSTAGLILRYQKEAVAFWEEDLRLDMDAFRQFDVNILRQCAPKGKKRQTIETLIKTLHP